MEGLFIPINARRQGYREEVGGSETIEHNASGVSQEFDKTPPAVTEKPMNKMLIYILAYFGYKYFL